MKVEESVIWQQILAYIEQQISKPSFEAWFQSTKGFLKDERELIIEAPNQFARDWLESRYSTLIDEAIDIVKSEIDSYLIVLGSGADETAEIRVRRRLKEHEITELNQKMDQLLQETQEVKEQNLKIIKMLEERKEKTDE